jgi:hypothetical protein
MLEYLIADLFHLFSEFQSPPKSMTDSLLNNFIHAGRVEGNSGWVEWVEGWVWRGAWDGGKTSKL